MTRAKMLKRAPLREVAAGYKSGKWTVVGPAQKKRKNLYVSCICECGTIRDVRAENLAGKLSQSCGCSNADRLRELYTKPNNAAAIHKIYTAYKKGAEDRCHAWGLSVDEVDALVRQPCYYCGATATNRYTIRGPEFRHNGIDRINNAEGYYPDNVVPCCKDCNRAKHTLSRDDFIALAVRVVTQHGRRKSLAEAIRAAIRQGLQLSQINVAKWAETYGSHITDREVRETWEFELTKETNSNVSEGK
jgi:hypothetical protein